MKFSKTTEYALRVLVYMSTGDKDRYSSETIHHQLQIPKKYLQQLLTQLTKKGLLIGNKGKYGGFILAKSTQDIFISEIVDAVEGFSNEFNCIFGLGSCALKQPCPLHDSWTEAQSQVIKVLSTTRLSELKA